MGAPPPSPWGAEAGCAEGGCRRGTHRRGTQKGHAEGTRRGGAQRRTQREHAEGGRTSPLRAPLHAPFCAPLCAPPPPRALHVLCTPHCAPLLHARPLCVPPLRASPVCLPPPARTGAPPSRSCTPPALLTHIAHGCKTGGRGCIRCGWRGRGCGRGPLPHPASPPSHSPFAGNGVGSAQGMCYARVERSPTWAAWVTRWLD